MAEFDFDFNWDISETAQKLNLSLFGKEKKKKRAVIFTPEKQNVFSSIVHDSDDEQYTKKGKKKLKKKIGKLKKKQSEDGNDTRVAPIFEDKDTDTVHDSSIVTIVEGRKKRKLSGKKEEAENKSTKKRKVCVDEPEGRKGRISDDESSMAISENQTPKKKRKQRSLEDTVNVSEEKMEKDSDGLSKRKRNRKKKNNPSKNKYRHLALAAKAVSDMQTGLEYERGSVEQSQITESQTQMSTSREDKCSSKKGKRRHDSKVANGSDESVTEKSASSSESVTGKKKPIRKKLKDTSHLFPSGISKKKPTAEKAVSFSSMESTESLEDGSKSKLNKITLQKMLSESGSSSKTLKKKSRKNEKNVTEMKSGKKSPAPVEDEKETVEEKQSHVSSIWGKASGLAQQAKETLNSARFRFLNEQLYTCTGSEAKEIFKQDREAFLVYHNGFQGQVEKWEVNPLDVIIKQMKDKPNTLVIADFGCGEGRLAQSVPQKVHSFDLVALSKHIVACDMAKVPLSSESVDIAVFCLALMGTNLNDYIAEANRVLKTGGLLKVAEVVSRFQGLSPFISAVCAHGFTLLNKRDLTPMFYMMDFKKVKTVKKSFPTTSIQLKPCIYKRR